MLLMEFNNILNFLIMISLSSKLTVISLCFYVIATLASLILAQKQHSMFDSC